MEYLFKIPNSKIIDYELRARLIEFTEDTDFSFSLKGDNDINVWILFTVLSLKPRCLLL